MTNAVDTLRKAAQLIEDRAAQRDRPGGEKSMLATVTAFNAIHGTSLSETQGWHFMELLKMVRSAYGVYVPDDYEDKVAYAALAAESAGPPLGLGDSKAEQIAKINAKILTAEEALQK